MSSIFEKIYGSIPARCQNVLLSARGWQLRRRRFGRRYRDFRALLSRSETRPREELERTQFDLLKKLLARAVDEVPYYREMFKRLGLSIDDFRSLSDLGRLPILTKDAIREHRHRLVSEAVSRRSLLPGHTSGTTGSSLTFFWDTNVDVATNAVIWRHREWAGFHFGQPYGTLLGQVVVPLKQTQPPFWRHNRPWNQTFFSTFHMKPENLDCYLDEMERRGILALEGYPSTVYILARHMRSRERFLPLRAVFTSAEPLLDLQRELIEERFQCRIFDYFGAAERVMFAGECPSHSGLHLFTEYGVTEVLDEEDQPVSVGHPGRLVLTGLHNYAMPLIRYEIGDVSGISQDPCPCGRPLPLLLPVVTKEEDIIVLPDGRFVSPSILTHPFKPITRIAESQIIQETTSSLRILVVPREGYGLEDEARLLKSLRQRVGEQIDIQIEAVDSIPRGPRGKFRWVISKVNLRFGSDVGGNLFVGDNEQEDPRSP